MTTVGAILDEFFSPFSSETMWVMPESDGYTEIVRKWKPVIQSQDRIKNNLKNHCGNWSSNYKTNSSWKPTKTNAVKKGAYRDFVPSPPGTDPATCKSAFILYVGSKVGGWVPGAPKAEIQTFQLYTCSIGSFNIYATVDQVDCAKKTATLNYWMYNSMSKRSFGRFASHPAFKLSGMKTQYMWWNWTEDVDWSSGSIKVVPKKKAGGGW